MIRQFVIAPLLQTYGFNVFSETLALYLLIAASVLIVAGGYVLNDYFDMKIDAINKPDKQLVGKVISKQTAMLTHQILTFLGVISGLLLAWYVRSFTLGFLFIVGPGLLWFYSASYKRQLIIGNLVVAVIAGMSFLIIGITEMAFLQKKFGNLIFETPIPAQIYAWTGGFAIFSLLLTWIREIIKDLEDEYGDRELECRTMPIVWGTRKTKIVLWAMILLTITLLFMTNHFFIPFEGTFTLRYIIFGLTLPLVALSYLILRAKNRNDYHQASGLTKFIMLIGILYAPVIYLLLAKEFGLSLFNIFIIQ
ncbi:MAG: geranylgeranylglycerol-phosphate geranylgeranyltransferase [Paludibacter sp.]|nr:geranylgeranylglycerol-phosphate geranylgeranyltransferase [Paludibacter sp.]